ncbi:hypothetical protein GCM10009837_26840 [Streptomyces durmitorensis]
MIVRELLWADSYAYSELGSTLPELSAKVTRPVPQALWDRGARVPAPPVPEEADVT